MVDLIRDETPMELFNELVHQALDHQGMDSSEDSAFYLAQLLDSFVRPESLVPQGEDWDRRGLGELLLTAARLDGVRKFKMLKFTGDMALFVCGFWGTSRQLPVDPAYYVQVGGSAYGSIAVGCARWKRQTVRRQWRRYADRRFRGGLSRRRRWPGRSGLQHVGRLQFCLADHRPNGGDRPWR